MIPHWIQIHGNAQNGVMERCKWFIKRATSIHLQGKRPNIFIFSTARSGSTWLMEMIASQRQIKFINEPLLLTRFRHGGPLPPSWDFLLPHSGREPALESYFRQLLENKIGIGSPAPLSTFHRFVSKRIVIKDLRCQDLMNWFEEVFNLQIIYLIRHPIPTNLSRKRYGRLHLFLSNDTYCQRYLTPQLRAYASSVGQNGSELERAVVDWCLQNLPPMKFLDRSKWICLHYEDMVLQPAPVVDKLANYLGGIDKTRMLRQMTCGSGSMGLSDAETRRFLAESPENRDKLYLVNRWRKRVTAKEEEKVFEILKNFEMDSYVYGDDLPARRLQGAELTQ